MNIRIQGPDFEEVKGSRTMSVIEYNPGKAIQLIYFRNGELHLSQKGINFLRKCEHRIATICIAGPCRSFKSSLLNFILEKNGAFEVGPTTDVCTKGIWIYPKPIPLKRAGQAVDLYLLDCEGLGGFEKDKNYDDRLFALMLLLSSTLLYNSVGVLDEAAISELSLVTMISKQIQIRRQQSKQSESSRFGQLSSEVAKFMPNLCWVLRDFHLDLINEKGLEISEDEYLDNALEEVQFENRTELPGVQVNGLGSGRQRKAEIQEKNQIRKLIKAYFLSRKLFTLSRPTDREEDLQNIKTDSELIRPVFLKQIAQLRDYLMESVRPFTLDGIAIGGEEYIALIQAYLESMNSGTIPVITDAWQDILKQQTDTAMLRAFERFKENLVRQTDKESFVELQKKSLREFDEIAKREKKESINLLMNSRGKFELKFDALAELKHKIKEFRDILRRQFVTQTQKSNKQTLEQLYRKQIAGEEYQTMQDYVKDWNNLREDYFFQIQDPIKYQLYSTYAVDKIEEGCVRINHNQLVQCEEERRRLQHDNQRMLEEIQNSVDIGEKDSEIKLLKEQLRSKEKRLQDQAELLRDYDQALLNQESQSQLDLVGSHISKRQGPHRRAQNTSSGRKSGDAQIQIIDLDSSSVSSNGFCGKKNCEIF